MLIVNEQHPRRVLTGYLRHAAFTQIADLDATRTRLREDRQAGLYDSAADADWYRTEYQRLGEEIAALRTEPERKPGLRMIGTGRTIAQEWRQPAGRREMLAEFEARVVLHPAGPARGDHRDVAQPGSFRAAG